MDRQDVVYQVVAARRAQWDMLVWQVPVLSLTAQAFLFTIALGADSSRTARVISAGLALAMAFLSITLMARHRRAEIMDANWLAQYESDHLTGPTNVVHGPTFGKNRPGTLLEAGRFADAIPNVPGFKTWVYGLSGFGAAALLVLVLAIAAPGLLEH